MPISNHHTEDNGTNGNYLGADLEDSFEHQPVGDGPINRIERPSSIPKLDSYRFGDVQSSLLAFKSPLCLLVERF
jgi:hypothetical protein